jgi:hypothetical protein
MAKESQPNGNNCEHGERYVLLAADNERLQREIDSLRQELAAAKRELHRLRGRSGAAARQPEAMSTMATRLRDALRE